MVVIRVLVFRVGICAVSCAVCSLMRDMMLAAVKRVSWREGRRNGNRNDCLSSFDCVGDSWVAMKWVFGYFWSCLCGDL